MSSAWDEQSEVGDFDEHEENTKSLWRLVENNVWLYRYVEFHNCKYMKVKNKTHMLNSSTRDP